jgi:L,D-transpeptidase YbiS
MHAGDTISFKVDIAQQKLFVLQSGKELWQASVSTSLYGCGEEEGSFKTPRGRHHIEEKIGENFPKGMIFKSRQPTGEIWTPETDPIDDDLILTRILWLAGDDKQNSNSFSRYIYFHGTNHESKIGTPQSHGCIRLLNDDIVTLFDFAEVGTPVEIVSPAC